MNKNSNWMSISGFISLAIGAIIMFSGLLRSGAPEDSDTLNMGLLNDKTNLVLVGGFIFVAGAISAASHFLISALRGPRGESAAISTSTEVT